MTKNAVFSADPQCSDLSTIQGVCVSASYFNQLYFFLTGFLELNPSSHAKGEDVLSSRRPLRPLNKYNKYLMSLFSAKYISKGAADTQTIQTYK